MPHDPAKLCEDVLRSIDEVETFCHNKGFQDFQQNRGLQLIVERELEIIGEALARLRRDHPKLADEIRDIDKIVGLRNILAHGYDILEREILWDIVENKLTTLRHDIQQIN